MYYSMYMAESVSATEFQRNIGKYLNADEPIELVRHSKPAFILVPILDEDPTALRELIEDYVEDAEIRRNKKGLDKMARRSLRSGKSAYRV